MPIHRQTFTVETHGKDTHEITERINAVVKESGVTDGMCNVFIQHTSASLIIQENADRNVQRDLNAWMSREVQDGDPLFRHREEGPDDMSAHIRSVLTEVSLSIPVIAGRCALGTWQGIFLWEHRVAPHRRTVTVSVWA